MIYKLFLLKALFLGLTGGILGYVIGTVAGVILGPYLAGITVQPLYLYLIWSLALSVLISLTGTLIPAYLASKIDPHTNLQEE